MIKYRHVEIQHAFKTGSKNKKVIKQCRAGKMNLYHLWKD